MSGASTEEVAFHEAAHAVCAAEHGLTVTRVQLMDLAGFNGGVWHHPSVYKELIPWSDPDLSAEENLEIWSTWLMETPSPELVARTRDEVLVSMSGPLGQFKRFEEAVQLDLHRVRNDGRFGWAGDHAKSWPMLLRLAAWTGEPRPDSPDVPAEGERLQRESAAETWAWLTPTRTARMEAISAALLQENPLLEARLSQLLA